MVNRSVNRKPPFTPSRDLEDKARAIVLRQNPASVESTNPYLTTSPTPYQLQCAARVRDLTDFCAEEYNIDPADVRLIASALLPSNHLPCWMIYETVRTPFWNHLNYSIKALGYRPVFNVSGMRMLNERHAREFYTDMIAVRHENPRVFIDTHHSNDRRWRKRVGPGHAYWLITAECARATVPAVMMKLPREGAEEEFARLLRMVVDPHARQVLPKPVQPPPALVELIHTVPRLNPKELSDAEPFFTCILMLASGHAALFGRTNKQLIDADYFCAMSALRGGIRQDLRGLLYFYHHLEQKKDKFWANLTDIGAHMPQQRRGVMKYMRELEDWGVVESRMMKPPRTGLVKARRFYKLTELGRLGAALVGNGPLARWW